jgi:site-specific recombinase XerD
MNKNRGEDVLGFIPAMNVIDFATLSLLHLARHTFAISVTLGKGIDIMTVSKMLGHKNLRTTQIYSKVTELKIAEDMKKLM